AHGRPRSSRRGPVTGAGAGWSTPTHPRRRTSPAATQVSTRAQPWRSSPTCSLPPNSRAGSSRRSSRTSSDRTTCGTAPTWNGSGPSPTASAGPGWSCPPWTAATRSASSRPSACRYRQPESNPQRSHNHQKRRRPPMKLYQTPDDTLVTLTPEVVARLLQDRAQAAAWTLRKAQDRLRRHAVRLVREGAEPSEVVELFGDQVADEVDR